jgi:hypothetical protein
MSAVINETNQSMKEHKQVTNRRHGHSSPRRAASSVCRSRTRSVICSKLRRQRPLGALSTYSKFQVNRTTRFETAVDARNPVRNDATRRSISADRASAIFGFVRDRTFVTGIGGGTMPGLSTSILCKSRKVDSGASRHILNVHVN